MFFGKITLAAEQRLNYGFREGPASFAGRQMQFSRGDMLVVCTGVMVVR